MAKPGRKPKQILTIGVDCGSLAMTKDNYMAGVASVVSSFVTEIKKTDKRNSYILYNYASFPSEFNVTSDRFRNFKVWPKQGYKTIGLSVAIRLTKPDVFLALSQAIPKNAPPTLGFIYDLAYLKFPTLYSHFEKLKSNTDELVKKSRHIVTISQSSKNDIIAHYKLPEDNVSICYPNIDSVYKADGPRYIGEHPYFLYVGRLSPTKNIPLLIKAFFSLLRETKQKATLVLIGDKSQEDPEIKKTIERFSLEKYVEIKGYVSKNDVSTYYRGAVAVVIPSLYEGFGLPVLEAFASGTPVIAADNSSLTELIGNAGMLFRDNDVQALSLNLIEIWKNQSMRTQLRNKGFKRVNQFAKNSFAKSILKLVYEKCMDK